MPLSEFHRGKPESNHNCSSDLSPFMPDNEFGELLWENGHIVVQGQSNKPKKTTFLTPFPYAAIPKIGLFETMDSSISSISAPVDDMDPWINYQDEEDPFCSEFYTELFGIPGSLSSERNNGSGVRDLHNAEHGHTSRGFREGQEPGTSKAQQCQTLIPSSRPRVTDFSSSLNFSSFSRPVTRTKANDDHTDRLKSTNEASAAPCTNPVESTLGSAANPLHVSVETSEAFVPNNVATDNRSFAASMAIGRHEAEQGPDAMVASSACSGSSPGSGSNDAKRRDKRKNREANESGFLSEDLEDDSFGERRPPTARAGSSTKRSRAAQVHNQSERRRRERINEKMRALQELIPNCNKVDKASMLDEAIEYLKILQLQVQMMSMRSGLCMCPMMLPPGTQHFRAPPMAHFSPMGLGMGMGTFYVNGCPMVPVPPVHAPQLPCASVAGVQLFGGLGQGLLPISMRGAQLFSPFPGLTEKANSVNELSGTVVQPTMPILDADPPSSCKDQQRQRRDANLEATQKTSN